MKRYRAKRDTELTYIDDKGCIHEDYKIRFAKGMTIQVTDDFEEVEQEKEIEPLVFDGSYSSREYHLTHKVNEVISVLNNLRKVGSYEK